MIQIYSEVLNSDAGQYLRFRGGLIDIFHATTWVFAMMYRKRFCHKM